MDDPHRQQSNGQNEKIRRLVWSLLPAYMRERQRAQQDVGVAALEAAEEEAKTTEAGRRKAAIQEILAASKRLQSERHDAQLWEAVEAAVACGGSSTPGGDAAAHHAADAGRRGPPGPGEHKHRILELRAKSEMFRQRCAAASGGATTSTLPDFQSGSSEWEKDTALEETVPVSCGGNPSPLLAPSILATGLTQRGEARVVAASRSYSPDPKDYASRESCEAARELEEYLANAILTEAVPLGGASFLLPLSRLPPSEQHALRLLTAPKTVAVSLEKELRRKTVDALQDERHAAAAILATVATTTSSTDDQNQSLSATNDHGEATRPISRTGTADGPKEVTSSAPGGSETPFILLHDSFSAGSVHHGGHQGHADGGNAQSLLVPQGAGYAHVLTHGTHAGYVGGSGGVASRGVKDQTRCNYVGQREMVHSETLDWSGALVPPKGVTPTRSSSHHHQQHSVIATLCSMKPLMVAAGADATKHFTSESSTDVENRGGTTYDVMDGSTLLEQHVSSRRQRSAPRHGDNNLAKEALSLYDRKTQSKGSRLVCLPLPKMTAALAASQEPSSPCGMTANAAVGDFSLPPNGNGSFSLPDRTSSSPIGSDHDSGVGYLGASMFSRPVSAAVSQPTPLLKDATTHKRLFPLNGNRPMSSSSGISIHTSASTPSGALPTRGAYASGPSASLPPPPPGPSIVDRYGRPVDMRRFRPPDELSLRTCILDATPQVVATNRVAVGLQRLSPPPVAHCLIEAVPHAVLAAGVQPPPAAANSSLSSKSTLRHAVPDAACEMMQRWARFQSIPPEDRVNASLPITVSVSRPATPQILSAARATTPASLCSNAPNHTTHDPRRGKNRMTTTPDESASAPAYRCEATLTGGGPRRLQHGALRGTEVQTMFCRRKVK